MMEEANNTYGSTWSTASLGGSRKDAGGSWRADTHATLKRAPKVSSRCMSEPCTVEILDQETMPVDVEEQDGSGEATLT